jgi:hypothetical protein
LALDTSQIINILSALSSIAVTASAFFIILQLRQNSKVIRATLHQEKSNISFSMLEQITDESFARRRYQMHEAVKKYGALNWAGFDDSLADFEARNFAYIYELFGQLAKNDVVEFATLAEALKYLVVVDWRIFKPFAEHLAERYKVRINAWENFEWLANETEKYMSQKGAGKISI